MLREAIEGDVLGFIGDSRERSNESMDLSVVQGRAEVARLIDERAIYKVGETKVNVRPEAPLNNGQRTVWQVEQRHGPKLTNRSLPNGGSIHSLYRAVS